MKFLLFNLFFFFLQIAYAQNSPTQNANFNYTYIPFEWDAVKNASSYILYIRETVSSKIIFSKKININVFLVKDILQFGKKYEWQVESIVGTKRNNYTNWIPFSINANTNLDKKHLQFNVTTAKKNAFQNDILFIEHLGIAINRKGNPVWFLAKDESVVLDDKTYRSMQMNDDGNITFLTSSNAYETDLQGNLLWQAPKEGILNIGSQEEYHHHFAKMPFGSYMCTSYAYVKQAHLKNKDKQVTVRYNTLLEFDKNGNLVWSWNEKDHTDPKIIFENSTGDEDNWAGTHMNGFAFSALDNSMFLSYRNSSQVQKIDYLTGKLLYTWSGQPSKFNNPAFTFFNQHGPSVTADGNIIIYNNNIQNFKNDTAIYPTIQIVQNVGKNKEGMLLWEYVCKWAEKKKGIQSKEGFAIELLNKNILVNMGGTERIFEITKNKEIVWDCNFKKLDKDSNFVPFANYRCYTSTTLHPVLFAIHTKNTKNGTILNISNLGNADTYTITVLDDNEKMLLHTFNTKVAANTAINVNLNKEILALPIKYTIKVTSKLNNSKTKILKN